MSRGVFSECDHFAANVTGARPVASGGVDRETWPLGIRIFLPWRKWSSWRFFRIRPVNRLAEFFYREDDEGRRTFSSDSIGRSRLHFLQNFMVQSPEDGSLHDLRALHGRKQAAKDNLRKRQVTE